MKKISALILSVVGVVGLLAAPAANALVTTYTTEASWLTAVGSGSVLENFNDPVFAGPLTSITGGSFQSGTNAFSGQQVYGGVIGTGSSMTFNFSTAISALGGLWDLAGPGGMGSNITLNLVGGGTETIVDYFSNTLAGSFRGFAASSAFTSMTLSMGTACCQETFQLENLRYTPVSPVPEPETYAMFMVGLGLIGFMARRRKEDFNS